MVIDEHVGAAQLVAAVEGELESKNQSRVEGRVRYRNYWHQRVDGFEELRTWLELLAMKGGGQASSQLEALQCMYSGLTM